MARTPETVKAKGLVQRFRDLTGEGILSRLPVLTQGNWGGRLGGCFPHVNTEGTRRTGSMRAVISLDDTASILSKI